MKWEIIGHGEVTYARLGASLITGRFKLWRSTGGTYGDSESHEWEWLLDDRLLTVTDEHGERYVLPTDNALLERLAEGKLVTFEPSGPTTWTAHVTTYQSHHLGSVSSAYDVTIDTQTARALVVAQKRDVDLD